MGFKADILALRRDYPDVSVTSLEEWLRREGWAGKREITVRRDSMGRPISAALPVSPRLAQHMPLRSPSLGYVHDVPIQYR
jgi:hypothetical protein